MADDGEPDDAGTADFAGCRAQATSMSEAATRPYYGVLPALVLSRRVKDSLQIAIAIAIIYAISFSMGWEKPYWAAVGAASINLLSAGLTLHRGLLRVLGTIAGGFTGLAIVALFPQERWAYLIASCIVLACFTYLMTGQKETYFFIVCGITFTLVMGVTLSIDTPASGVAFQVTMLRITQTLMGSLIMVLVTVYLWPTRTLGDFEDLARKGWANQHTLFRAYRDMLSRAVRAGDAGPLKIEAVSRIEHFVPSTAEAERELRLEDAKFQLFGHLVLHGAEQDSYEMLEVGHHWHRFMHETAAQMEALESLRESLAEVEGLELITYLPDLEALSAELDRRFEQTGRMLAREAPTHMAQPVSLSFDAAALRDLTHLQVAALMVTKAQLEKLEAVSRSLFDCVAEIRMVERPGAERHGHAHEHHGHGEGLAIHPDRLRNAAAVVATWSVAFLLWVYVYDIPEGPLYWTITGVFALLMAYRSEIPWLVWYWSWGLGIAVAGVCYVFIMQHLSGYVELSALISICVFGMYYLLHPYWHVAGRMFAVICFTIVVSATNEQEYDLAYFITHVLWLMLGISTAVLVRGLFFKLRPEQEVLLLLDRFFRHADFLLSAQAPEGAPKSGIATRLKAVLYRNDLLEVPATLVLHAERIDYRMLPGTTLEQVQDLVGSLYALAYRIKDLHEARQVPLPDLLKESLLQKKRDWHETVDWHDTLVDWFRRWARRIPAKASADALPVPLDRLEARIAEVVDRAGGGSLSREDYEKFLRLLGSYRGLSAAVIDYSARAEGLDWQRWRETRF